LPTRSPRGASSLPGKRRGDHGRTDQPASVDDDVGARYAERFNAAEWPDRAGSATQVARARYAARGFDAAAITVFVEVAGEVAEPAEGQRVREAALRFERPYAVVAVAPADGSAEPVSRDAFR
jgi:hypothetical protein